jgi:arsenite methyltransferase
VIDCREAVRRMWAYLEHELAAAPTAEFEGHLETCQRCCGELEFSRHLREMVAEKGVPAMPPDVRSRIDVLLADADRAPGGTGVTDFHIDGGDLLSQDAIRSIVRDVYGRVGPTDRRVAERFYSPEEIASLPDETVRIALGVGNPVRAAGLRLGDDVADLGSGGGIDCLLAARAVGASGSVVGIDFLADMVGRSTRAASAAGLANARFVEGLMEDVPLGDASVDVVISNGVVNLSPRKVRVLAEAFRILRPGGRLAIVDLVLEHDLPPEIQTHPAAWAGCLSGALSEVALYKGLRRAGFRDVSIETLEPFGIAECALYPLFGEDLLALLRAVVPPGRHDRIAMAVLVRGRKPEAGEQLRGRARE